MDNSISEIFHQRNRRLSGQKHIIHLAWKATVDLALKRGFTFALLKNTTGIILPYLESRETQSVNPSDDISL